MNWDDLRHFGALAEAGSLSEAARRLKVEHATVARRIAALEAGLGLALVDRRGRRWVLTADGLRIAEIARRMEAEAQAVRRAAQGAQRALTGTVTISAPPALAAARLAAPLVALREAHPGLTIRLIGEVRSASLTRAEADMAVRLSRPQEGDLVITRLGRMDFRPYATPAYLAAHHDPRDWRFIGNDAALATAPQQQALEAFAAGRAMAMSASSVEIQHAAARAGGGIALLPDFLGAEDPALAVVPPGRALVSRKIFLVVHSELRRAAPIQAVAAALKTAFRPPPSGGPEEEPADDGLADDTPA